MRISGCTSILAIVLATAPVTFANAQTTDQPGSPAAPTTNVVTQQEFSSTVQDINRRTDRKVGQAKQQMGKALKDAQTANQQAIANSTTQLNDAITKNAKSTNDNMNDLFGDLGKRMAGESALLKTLYVALGIACVIFVAFGMRMMGSHRETVRKTKQAMEEHELAVQQKITDMQKLMQEQLAVMGIVIYNPSADTLRDMCRELRKKDPRRAIPIFSQKVSPKPELGLYENGVIHGIKAFFKEGPLDGQKPMILFPGDENPVKYGEITKRASEILRGKASGVQSTSNEDATSNVIHLLEQANRRSANS